MKKVIILLVLIFTTLSVGAQIKRNFDGIILGKTTKKEVKSYLSKKSHYCEEKEDGNAILSENETSFGGVLWDGTYYSFHKDTLYRVTYTKIVRGKEKELRAKYKELREAFYKKYVKRTPKDNSNDYSPETKIKDKSTFIKLSIMKHSRRPGIKYLKLSYVDTNLENKVKKQNVDEL
jgi:DNA topoisomerase IA